jgi:hypothetical protein
MSREVARDARVLLLRTTATFGQSAAWCSPTWARARVSDLAVIDESRLSTSSLRRPSGRAERQGPPGRAARSHHG